LRSRRRTAAEEAAPPGARGPVAGRVRGLSVRLHYLSRVARALALRGFLRACLGLFSLEGRVRPVRGRPGMRVLIIVIGGLGDCLLFDPLFRRLRERWPGARVDVFTACFPQLWERLESVDRVHLFPLGGRRGPCAYFSLFRALYRGRYHIVADGISMVPRRGIYPILSSLVFQATRAPVRVGRELVGHRVLLHPRRLRKIHGEKIPVAGGTAPGRVETPRGNPYITHAIRPCPPQRRDGPVCAEVLAPLGIPFHRNPDEPRLGPDPVRDRRAERRLREGWARAGETVVGFTTETTHPLKAWPEPFWLEVLERGAREGLRFVRMGLGRTRPGSCFPGIRGGSLLDLCGSTDLGEMLALIRACDLFLSCDTGPAHVAQAFGVPTVVLFGPSNEREFGPVDRARHTLILPPGELPCRPCVLGPCVRGGSCVREIRPDQVFQALMHAVRRTRGGRP